MTLSFFFATRPGHLSNFYPVVNPLGVDQQPVLWSQLLSAAVGLMALAILASAASLVLRVRHASAVETQQLKWVAFNCAWGAAGMLASFVFGHYSALSAPLVLGGLLGIHMATALAILRYRLDDIDIIINRTLVYGALSFALIGLYFGSVLLLQQLAVGLTGQRQSQVVTVVSTLAITAMAAPLRSRLQTIIDRRFFRRKYDAAKALALFSIALRADPQADIHRLSQDLNDVVQDAIQPASVSLWVKPAAGAQSIFVIPKE